MQPSRILGFGEPDLHTASAPVGFPDAELSEDIAKLCASLDQFQSDYGWGRAMAAPQIGIKKRIIVMNLSHGHQLFINPQITFKSKQIQRVWDDCMSLPNIAVEVDRYLHIGVRFQDPLGQWHTIQQCDADMSELLQHEIDHLDGIVMTDRIVRGGAIIERKRKAEYSRWRSLQA